MYGMYECICVVLHNVTTKIRLVHSVATSFLTSSPNIFGVGVGCSCCVGVVFAGS